jgi:hypothetical protein
MPTGDNQSQSHQRAFTEHHHANGRTSSNFAPTGDHSSSSRRRARSTSCVAPTCGRKISTAPTGNPRTVTGTLCAEEESHCITLLPLCAPLCPLLRVEQRSILLLHCCAHGAIPLLSPLHVSWSHPPPLTPASSWSYPPPLTPACQLEPSPSSDPCVQPELSPSSHPLHVSRSYPPPLTPACQCVVVSFAPQIGGLSLTIQLRDCDRASVSATVFNYPTSRSC